MTNMTIKFVQLQLSHQVRDAAVVRVRGTNKGLAMTTDCNSRYIYLDPEVGGEIAVAEAARNIVCSGGQPLAITDCLNFGNPEKPEIFWQIEKSADGIAAACIALNAPVIGGNVSLIQRTFWCSSLPNTNNWYGWFSRRFSTCNNTRSKTAGDVVYVIGETKTEFGGSELQKLVNGDIFR